MGALSDCFKQIGDAIRYKLGSDVLMAPVDMPGYIDQIPTKDYRKKRYYLTSIIPEFDSTAHPDSHSQFTGAEGTFLKFFNPQKSSHICEQLVMFKSSKYGVSGNFMKFLSRIKKWDEKEQEYKYYYLIRNIANPVHPETQDPVRIGNVFRYNSRYLCGIPDHLSIFYTSDSFGHSHACYGPIYLLEIPTHEDSTSLPEWEYTPIYAKAGVAYLQHFSNPSQDDKFSPVIEYKNNFLYFANGKCAYFPFDPDAAAIPADTQYQDIVNVETTYTIENAYKIDSLTSNIIFDANENIYWNSPPYSSIIDFGETPIPFDLRDPQVVPLSTTNLKIPINQGIATNSLNFTFFCSDGVIYSKDENQNIKYENYLMFENSDDPDYENNYYYNPRGVVSLSNYLILGVVYTFYFFDRFFVMRTIHSENYTDTYQIYEIIKDEDEENNEEGGE